MLRAIFLFIAFAAGSGANAGAWPREQGAWFVAFGGNFLLSDGSELPVHYDPTLFVEYGLTERITIGLESHLADTGRIASDLVSFTIPIGDLTAADRFSVGVGFGLRRTQFRPSDLTTADFDYLRNDELMRASLSWGRGIEQGWLAVDASATYAIGEDKWRPKADATWGRHWNDTWTTTLQLQMGQGFSNDYYAKISPTAIYHFNDTYSASLGAVQGLTGDRGAGLKLEVWASF